MGWPREDDVWRWKETFGMTVVGSVLIVQAVEKENGGYVYMRVVGRGSKGALLSVGAVEWV